MGGVLPVNIMLLIPNERKQNYSLKRYVYFFIVSFINRNSILHGPSMFAVKAKIYGVYIIKPAQSLLMKHLVIGQR